jgi:hypothetical protein
MADAGAELCWAVLQLLVGAAVHPLVLLGGAWRHERGFVLAEIQRPGVDVSSDGAADRGSMSWGLIELDTVWQLFQLQSLVSLLLSHIAALGSTNVGAERTADGSIICAHVTE